MQDHGHDPTDLARAAIIWTWVWLSAEVIAGAGLLYQNQAMSALSAATPYSFFDTLPELETSDTVMALIGLVYLVALIVCTVLLLKWVYRVNANARLLSDDMTISPGWNVGWFFVPIANVWKPFEGVRESWRVSHGDDVDAQSPLPAVFYWWWGSFLVYNFLGNLSLRVELSSETVGDVIRANYLALASLPVAVVLAFSWAVLVRSLTDAQVARMRRRVFEPA